MKKILEVKNICKTYQSQNGEIKALKNISFDIKEGEYISIIGPSGCGKSTLLSIISGLESKSSGEIYIDGKIVVLAGGTSTERDVSLVTGYRVCESLRRNGHEANMLDIFLGVDDSEVKTFFTEKNDLGELSDNLKKKTADIPAEVKRRTEARESFFGRNVLELCKEADMVFMGLHGSNGEDGKVQATFDLLGIRYTGTDYLSSAISMSKELAKKVLVPEGIPMPKGVTLHKGHKIEYVPFPCVVKPCCGGSSVGVSIAYNEKEFEDALNEAFSYEDTVLVEAFKRFNLNYWKCLSIKHCN